MRINPKALAYLIYLTDKDVEAGFCHGAESNAKTLSDYIYEYTENLPFHMPAGAKNSMIGEVGFKDIIKNLNLIRKKEIK
jgi:hypothetical protein